MRSSPGNVTSLDDHRPGIVLVDPERKIATHVLIDELRGFVEGRCSLDLTEDEVRIIIKYWLNERSGNGA